MTVILEVYDLYKSYGKHHVIKGISFTVEKGEVFALLGTNGAGKTTTLECIEGLRTYNQGKITLYGTLGVQLQSSSLPDNMKVIEAMTLFSKWNNKKVNHNVIERMGLQSLLSKQYKELSTGQKRRLHLAMALIADPDILFLDEPTAGLDVEGRFALHEELRNLKKQGKTLVLASHDMAEVEELCDRIAILKDGKLAYCGNTADIKHQIQDSFTIRLKTNTKPDFQQIAHGIKLPSSQGYEYIKTNTLETCLMEILETLRLQQIRLFDVQVEKASLEQRFMEIAKEG